MPFVQVSLQKPRSSEVRKQILDAVHEALLATLNSPREDRFQIITTHGDDLVYSPDYLGIQRSDEIVIVQIMIFPGKPVELKQKLVSSIAQQLHFSVGIRLEDVMVILHEVAKENWSFGNGVAQHVTGN